MSTITIYGPAVSSYVRTARWACAEKGVAHELKPIELGSAAHRALHPFCKVPVLEDGDLILAESLAIVAYVDASADGRALIPADARQRGEALKWVSHVNAYLYARLIPGYALKYVLPAMRGEEPDRAAIEAGVPGLLEGLDILEDGLGDSSWFAGPSLSIADLFVAPIVHTVGGFPEAAAALETKPNLKRLIHSVEKRAAWQAVQPSA